MTIKYDTFEKVWHSYLISMQDFNNIHGWDASWISSENYASEAVVRIEIHDE